jgi:hypothetical protein
MGGRQSEPGSAEYFWLPSIAVIRWMAWIVAMRHAERVGYLWTTSSILP